MQQLSEADKGIVSGRTQDHCAVSGQHAEPGNTTHEYCHLAPTALAEDSIRMFGHAVSTAVPSFPDDLIIVDARMAMYLSIFIHRLMDSDSLGIFVPYFSESPGKGVADFAVTATTLELHIHNPNRTSFHESSISELAVKVNRLCAVSSPGSHEARASTRLIMLCRPKPHSLLKTNTRSTGVQKDHQSLIGTPRTVRGTSTRAGRPTRVCWRCITLCSSYGASALTSFEVWRWEGNGGVAVVVLLVEKIAMTELA